MANQPKKYKKFVATAATATLVASAIVPVASAASFSDTTGNTHEAAISALSDAGIIKGYADGTFKPNKTLTRSDVVKLLGKYLVSEGYSIPTDAVSSPRFSDLTSKSNKELLEYAAVVADAGVFAGSNGKLLAGDPITRENMAIVLVRMVNTLKDVSLEEFVASQKFDREVKDLNAAKAEARTAIDVLDFYDITTATNFLPKNTVTRGQFATFLNNVINADFAGAATTTGTVKAINNTTVEVTFEDAVTDIKALDFAIKDLTISNAVIKQTDSKTVVLTTSAQTADVEYTVTVNEKEIGKFKGVSAVIPTAVNITEQSLQAQVGTQVTLKAQVEVAAGQSKAGIPVTFNIVNNASIGTATLNQPIVAEAKTDENGVATYTYTRYAQTSYQLASHDEVQAYATGNPTARSFSKVYWANIQPLAITEVTAGNAVTNGGKKVYKVKAALGHAEPILGANGVQLKDAAGNLRYKVNIGYKENINVTPDKAIKTVDVIDSKGTNLSYPGQFTSSTSGSNNLNNFVKEVELELDASGEAVFTLSGSNATITPFVFVDQKVNPTNAAGSEGRFESTELFAQAAQVIFSKVQTLGLTLESVGVQYAAAFLDNDKNRLADSLESIAVDGTKTFTRDQLTAALVNTGGRDYKATVTDKNGKLAPAGTPVKAEINIGSALKTNGGAVYIVDNNTRVVTKLTNDASTPVTGIKKTANLTTNAKGEVSFTLIGYQDAYATPTVYVESGDKAGLDANDLQQVGEIVYFSDAVVKTASLTVDEKSVTASETVEYTYSTVDQNGKAYRPATTSANYYVTFEVSTTFNPVNVTVGTGSFAHGSTAGEVGQGSTGTGTFVVQTNAQGVASIKVSSKNQFATSVNVVASASDASLPQLLTASNEFTTYATHDLHAKVESVNTASNTVDVTDVNGKRFTYSYAGQKLQINGTDAVSETAFEAALQSAILNPTTQSLSIKLVDGVYIFNVLTSTPAPKLPVTNDTTPPTITSVQKIGANQLKVTFSEAVSGVAASDYFVLANDNSRVGTVASVVANTTTTTTNDTVWILTTSAVLPTTATTLEYVGTGTQDLATTPNKLVSGTKAAIAATVGLQVTKTATTTPGVAPTLGKQVFEVGGIVPSITNLVDTLTIAYGPGTTADTVSVTFAAGDTTASAVANRIVAAINANTSVNTKFVASTDGIRVILTDKVVGTTNVVSTITLANATTTTLVDNASLSVTANTTGTPASQTFAITENLTGVATTKVVTIKIGAVELTKSVTFAATDLTAALVANRISTAFNSDGSIVGYSFTVNASDELVVSQTATNASPAAISLTIQ